MVQIKRQSSLFPLFVAAALWLNGSVPAVGSQESPPWGQRTLADIDPESEPELPDVRTGTETEDPARQALRLLDGPTPTPSPDRLPRLYRLADFVPGGRYDESETLRDRQEQASVRRLLSETDILMRNNRKELAFANLEEALPGIEAPYNRLAILARLGTLLFRDQQYDRAVIHMREAVQIEPADIVMVSNLAAGLLSIGDVDEALEHLTSINLRTIRNPSLAFSVLFNLACGYSLKNDVEKSLSHLLGAANVDPASTIASLGDTQLDNIRSDLRFKNLQSQLEAAFRPNR